ncbi:MAG: hypothetical protein AAFP83_00510, partial [Bacteroidota bacterium]
PMKKILLLVLVGGCLIPSHAQSDYYHLWEPSVQVGHQSLSLIAPDFSPIHPGVGVSILRRWNTHAQHQLIQRGTLDFFVHRDLQDALRLHTEVGYRYRSTKGWQVTPLALGGGYVLAFPNLATLERDNDGIYQEINTPTRQNWMLQVGADVGYHFFDAREGKGLSVDLSYRIQVQGTFANETVPVIAYAPLWLRLSLPI